MFCPLKRNYENGKIILLDRYTTSSIIYQAALIEDTQKRKDFINYVIDYEYNKLGIKEPDKTIFLHMPYEYSCILKKNREILDQHEMDEDHLKNAEQTYIELSELYNWNRIECIKDNEVRTIEEIGDEVYSLVKDLI
jgi:dTMP kinase